MKIEVENDVHKYKELETKVVSEIITGERAMGDKIISTMQIGGLILVAILFGQMPALVYCVIIVCGHLLQQPKKNALMFEVEVCILKILRSATSDEGRKSEWATLEELEAWCKVTICGYAANSCQRSLVGSAVKRVLNNLLQEKVIEKNEKVQVNLLNTAQENGFKEAYRSLNASYRPQKKLAFWQIGVKKRLAQNEELVKEILGCLEEQPEGASLEEFVDVYGLLKSWYKTASLLSR